MELFTISVDQELRNLIQPLSSEELSLLRESLKRDGCLSPLIVWQHEGQFILLDGHNRFFYCQEQGIKYLVTGVNLSSMEEAKLWILTNQLGRRNLTDSQRSIIAAKRAKLMGVESRHVKAQNAKAVQSGNLPVGEGAPELIPKVPGNLLGGAGSANVVAPKVRIRTKVAQESKVPESMARKAQEVLDRSPELARKVETGEMHLTEAHHQVIESREHTSPAQKTENILLRILVAINPEQFIAGEDVKKACQKYGWTIDQFIQECRRYRD